MSAQRRPPASTVYGTRWERALLDVDCEYCPATIAAGQVMRLRMPGRVRACAACALRYWAEKPPPALLAAPAPARDVRALSIPPGDRNGDDDGGA